MQWLMVLFIIFSFGRGAELAVYSTPIEGVSYETHQLELITAGTTALKQYVDCIRQAQQQLYLEVFAFTEDKVGRLFIDELILRKRQIPDLEVALLIDSYNYNLSNTTEQFLVKEGLILKKWTSPSWFSPLPANHRKTFVCDDMVFLGGRNMGAHNFQLEEPRYDYTLRVEGALVGEIKRSFRHFFQGPHAKVVATQGISTWSYKESSRVLWEELTALAHEPGFLFTSDHLGYVSDSWQAEERQVSLSIASEMQKASSNIVIETPHFFLSAKPGGLYQVLEDVDVSVEIYTQSGARFGAKKHVGFRWHGANRKLNEIRNSKVTGHVVDKDFHQAHREELVPLFPGLEEETIGYHNKSVVIDKEKVFFSSFNFKIFSENYNYEHGIWIHDAPELAAFLLGLIEERGSQQVH